MYYSITQEAYSTIYQACKEDLVVFSMFTKVAGPGRCEILTQWSFVGSNIPLIGCRTTWDHVNSFIDYGERINEQHEYWICSEVCK